MAKKIAIIGAGWAGCAAACELAQQGHAVTLIESAKTLGGRARRVSIHGKNLDNGQHILLGAYTASLDLMKLVGIDIEESLMRLPLQMVYPHSSGMHFSAPRLPAPLHLFIALLRAKGLAFADKMALARFSSTARWMDWQLYEDCSVDELLERFDQTDRLRQLMWRPLCIAALNTPTEHASAKVFLAVLRDSLGAKRSASDMLIPRVDLSALLPDAAARFIESKGGRVVLGCAVSSLTQHSNHRWSLKCNQAKEQFDDHFDQIAIATNAEQARRLLDTVKSNSEHPQTFFDTQFRYEPITTCYLQYTESTGLDRPFYALLDCAEKNQDAQFVFDRGQLGTDQKGLFAVVISASTKAMEKPHQELARDIAAQLAEQLKMPELTTPRWHQIITEKRATFSCNPNLARPENKTSVETIVIAGDYTQSDYPATLEAAVRSGIAAANILSKLEM